MRTIITLPDAFIEPLVELCEEERVSRAEIIRRALEIYIQSHHRPKTALSKAFGLWKNRRIDALKYEEQLRSEWDEKK